MPLSNTGPSRSRTLFRSAAQPLAATALLMALAAPAAALCPATPEDAARGVLVSYDDGTTMAIRLRPDGLQEDIEAYNDGSTEGYFVLSKAGIFAIEETPMLGGRPESSGRWTFGYRGGREALPDIVPGLRWEGQVSQSEDGAPPATWKMSVVAGRLMTATHAGCTMQVIPVVSRTEDETGFVDFLAYDYIPAANLAVFRSYSESPQPDHVPVITSFGPYSTQ